LVCQRVLAGVGVLVCQRVLAGVGVLVCQRVLAGVGVLVWSCVERLPWEQESWCEC
jgi:hypothetical protein